VQEKLKFLSANSRWIYRIASFTLGHGRGEGRRIRLMENMLLGLIALPTL
jgi:hypothetical protein